MKTLDPKLHWWMGTMTDQLEALRPEGTEVIVAMITEQGDYYIASHLSAETVLSHLTSMCSDSERTRFILDKTQEGKA